jgi:hypothetical protein
MAQMIPDRLPSGSSKGEQRLFAILQKLPDTYLVYYEPVISQRYPDFVIVAPDLGVIVIEVKGWNPGDILAGDPQTIRVRERGVERVEPHPVRQARGYQNNLQDECRKSREARSLLLHAAGPHEGRFVFPFCHFAVLSNITSEQLKGHRLGDLTPIFPPSRVLPRDDLLEWEDLDVAKVRENIRAFFDPYWEIAGLTDRQVEVLRGIIHPEIRIESRFDPAQLAILDLRQERHARSIGGGHRIVYGVAGSGKTVLLISRAKLLSQRGPDAEILVLCFNVSLAAYLRGVLSGCGNVCVHYFDGWAKANRIVRGRGVDDGSPESDESLGSRLKEYLEQGNGDSRRFDAVLVDEAQDFDRTWFECVREAMKDPDDGDLLIVGDRQQGIYGAKTIVWSSVGIKAVGRSIHAAFDLDKNYRNSREILELAAAFAQDQEQLSDDQFGIVPVDPSKSLRATGVLPMLLRGDSRRHECQRVYSVVATLLQAGGRRDPRFPDALQPSQVGILYPWTPKKESPVLDEFIKRLQSLAPVIRLHGEDRCRVSEPGIKVQTIHSSKGLQYRAVVVLWADRLPRSFPDIDPDEDPKLMYVALTRAEDYLFISHSEPSDFIDRIHQSGKVVVC